MKVVWRRQFSRHWKKGVIVHVHKIGDMQIVQNYRYLSLPRTVYKMCAAELNERMKEDRGEEYTVRNANVEVEGWLRGIKNKKKRKASWAECSSAS